MGGEEGWLGDSEHIGTGDDVAMATRPKRRVEAHIQKDLVIYLRARDWLVERFIGNAWQTGIPDLLAHHPQWGSRWIDVKVEGKYSFTKAQRIKWPLWDKYQLGIWILTGADQANYDKLFAPPNWRDYWKASWALPTTEDIDRMLEEL